MAAALAVSLAGCGGQDAQFADKLETIASEVDDFRTASEEFMTSERECWDIAKLDYDVTSLNLCHRVAFKPYEETGLAIADSLDLIYEWVEVGSPCRDQVETFGRRIDVATKTAFRTVVAVGKAGDGDDVSERLHAFDRAFDRAESALVRARDLCDGA